MDYDIWILNIVVFGFLIFLNSTPIWLYFYLKKKRQKEERTADVPIVDKVITHMSPEVLDEDIYHPDSVLTELGSDRLVFDYSGKIIKPIFYVGIGFILLALFSIYDANKMVAKIMTIIGLIPLGIYAILFSLSGYRDKFIFDRQKGTVTYTEFTFFTRTVSFDKALFTIRKFANGGQMLGILQRDKVTWNNILSSFDDAEQLWSLLVWYMDKNRPLPPGQAFDSLRQSDYDRRSQEGFPAPLYPSFINTPDIGAMPDRYNKYTIDTTTKQKHRHQTGNL